MRSNTPSAVNGSSPFKRDNLRVAPRGLRRVCFVNLIIRYPTNEVETQSGSFDARRGWSHAAPAKLVPCGSR